jgi:hypothetical protein
MAEVQSSTWTRDRKLSKHGKVMKGAYKTDNEANNTHSKRPRPYHLLPLLEARQGGRAIAKQLGLELGADALERERLCVGVDGLLVTAGLSMKGNDRNAARE